MNTREKLRAARATLGPLVEKRSFTTETELDECVQALEELKRACTDKTDLLLSVMRESLGVVAERIKNRHPLGITPVVASLSQQPL